MGGGVERGREREGGGRKGKEIEREGGRERGREGGREGESERESFLVCYCVIRGETGE